MTDQPNGRHMNNIKRPQLLSKFKRMHRPGDVRAAIFLSVLLVTIARCCNADLALGHPNTNPDPTRDRLRSLREDIKAECAARRYLLDATVARIVPGRIKEI